MSETKMSEAELEAREKAAEERGYQKLQAEIKADKDHRDELDDYASEQVALALAEKEEEIEAEKKEAEEAEKKAKEDATKKRRLPDSTDAPYQAKYKELWKFDGLSFEDQAVMCGIMDSQVGKTASPDALKALAVKGAEHKGESSQGVKQAMKRAAIKGDEIMHTDLTSYGLEWVGTAYSDVLWKAIRLGTPILARLPSVEVPAGHSSIYLPLESTDPTYYRVIEVEDEQTSGWPNTTITSSQATTARAQLTLDKMGARVLWSGEMTEDSLIPFVPQLRSQLQVAGAEQLEHAIIDGHTAVTASTNINDIAGTATTADLFTMFNGFRVSPLVTTTANSRSGGTLTVEDYLETLKLMGSAGINALDRTKVSFIPDINVYWKSLELEEVKTQDVFSGATLEGGQLKSIWGYEVLPSGQMHRNSGVRKANADGKVDIDVTTNNTTGSLLAVRWDQWKFGWRRRMTMETTRIARADAYEIVALMRIGLIQRDTEASTITYNISV